MAWVVLHLRFVAARNHRELEAWQLAHKIRNRFIALTRVSHIKSDFDFCDQTNRAARSSCRNLAEGFYRFGHLEFAHFVNIAKGSLGELLDSTDEALEKKYIDRREYSDLNQEIQAALAVATALHRHLASTPTPGRPPHLARRT